MRREMFQSLNQKTTASTDLPNFGFKDDYEANKHLFHPAALEVFKTQTPHMIYQYNDSDHPYPEFYDTIELLGLLGLKSAYHNPLEGTFTRKIAVVQHFGFVCDKKDIDKARRKVINIVNDMAASGWLKASLCNLGSMELAVNPMFPSIKNRVAVFSYVAIKHDCERYVKDLYGNAMFKEGGMPPEFK